MDLSSLMDRLPRFDVTDADKRKAALNLCGAAPSIAEARDALEALDLLADLAEVLS